MNTTPCTYMESLVRRQQKAEQELLDRLQSGGYTLENPLVQLNPYLIAPLTALLLFETDVPLEAEITVLGRTPEGNITHRFPAACTHVLPIYGLYADYDNTVQVRLSSGRQTTVHITTEPLDKAVPPALSCTTTPEYFQDQLMFLTAAMQAVPVGYDYEGQVRWYCRANLSYDLKRLPNGHLLIGTERLVKLPNYVTGLYEMTMSGKIIKEYQFPGGYHHDHFPLPDGGLLVLTQDLYGETVEDKCILVDTDSGQILRTWDYKDLLPQYPIGGSGSQDEHDWFHNNAVWYDARTNSMCLSGRHQDIVINVDLATGQLNWILGDPEGWPQELVAQYFFTPIGEDFEWAYEQHGCVMLPDGDIMLFDNGHYRAKDPARYLLNKDNYSRGVRYRLDLEKRTIRQIWQYGKERGADFFSPYISNVEYYGGGHYMVHSGGIGYFDGLPLEGLPAQKALGPDKDRVTMRSITVELMDDEVVYELVVAANCYRAEKLPLYYAHETAVLGEAMVLGGLCVTPETRVPLSKRDDGPIPEHYCAHITVEDDRVLFNAVFEEGEYAVLVLEDERGHAHTYPISTVPQAFRAMCVGTFQKENPQNIDTFINKKGLSGCFTIKLLCETKLYNSQVAVDF